MSITRTLASQGADPHGPLGWLTAWIMPMFSDVYCGDLAGLLDLQPEDDVLEVACGSGVFLQKYASRVRHIAGIDHSEIQIRLASKRNRSRIAAGTVEVVRGDSAALPWEDARFGAVACNCLGCFAEPLRSLQEMYRVLRPGGRVALGIDFCPDETTARRAEQKWGLPYWTEAEARQMLVDAGFSAVAVLRAKKLTFIKAARQEPVHHQVQLATGAAARATDDRLAALRSRFGPRVAHPAALYREGSEPWTRPSSPE